MTELSYEKPLWTVALGDDGGTSRLAPDLFLDTYHYRVGHASAHITHEKSGPDGGQ
jgi:hypothetical protein